MKAKEFVNTGHFQNRLKHCVSVFLEDRTAACSLAYRIHSGNKKFENFNHYGGGPIHLVDSKTKAHVSKNINKLRSGLYKAIIFCKNIKKHEIVSGVIVSFIH